MASEDVARVHREAIIVEGHRDMFEMNYLAAKGQQYPVLNVTLPRLKRANISTTFYAISGDSLTHANGTYRFLHAALQNIYALRTEMAASQGQMKLILHRDIICANSSQAKGRVERANGTLQDRLVKEMRLRDIDTVAAGNAFLPTFMADYNARFSNRPFRVKRFQTIHHYSVDVAHGLVLLFGIGTRGPSIMGFEDEVEQSFGRPCRQTNGRSKRTCELTSSIVPRGTSFHRSVELEFPPIGLDAARFSCCCCGLFSGPAELGAVNPYAVHDHSQPACQGHDRLFHPAAPGDLHRPGFEPGPFLRPQHALSCFVEHDPHHLISAA